MNYDTYAQANPPQDSDKRKQRRSKLDLFADDIRRMLADGYTIAGIRRYLATVHRHKVTPHGLSGWLKRRGYWDGYELTPRDRSQTAVKAAETPQTARTSISPSKAAETPPAAFTTPARAVARAVSPPVVAAVEPADPEEVENPVEEMRRLSQYDRKMWVANRLSNGLGGQPLPMIPPVRCLTEPKPGEAFTAAQLTDMPAEVRDSDEVLEHPAIAGLMLTRAQRVYGKKLMFVDGTGMEWEEPVKLVSLRLKWQRPAPKVSGESAKGFVKIDVGRLGGQKI